MSESFTPTPEQALDIANGVADPSTFMLKRIISAIVELDGAKYNSFFVDAMGSNSTRRLDLAIKVLQTQQDKQAGSLPSTDEAIAAKIKGPIEPLKMGG